MHRLLSCLFLVSVVSPVATAALEVAPRPRGLELVAVESSLTTAGSSIRQFAFDENAATYFASEKKATKTDHFTFRIENPVTVKNLTVQTGRPTGEDKLATGVVELSTDGTKFEEAGKFVNGTATLAGNWKAVKAIRIRPTEDLTTPLVVREVTLDSDPKVTTFQFPIEFQLDVTDAPEMKDWAESVVRMCEREYPRICTILASEGFRPTTQIRMTLKADYTGVAYASGNRIVGSVKFFKANPKDIGAMFHETVHCVQLYRGRNNPGWLVEGVADYMRFWKYEPGKAGRVNPEKAQYNGSYRTTASFLAFVSDKYEGQLVPKLNAAMREGKYEEGLWRKLTGKTADELNQEWKKSLAN